MYLARDKNMELYLFDKRPVRGNECWWAESGVDGTYLRLDSSLFPELTWESDPLQVSLQVAGKDAAGKGSAAAAS